MYVPSILWVHPEFSNEFSYFKYTLNLFVKWICISFLFQECTWSRLSNFTNLFSNSEKYMWSILLQLMYMFKLRSIQEVYFPNWCFSFQTQKHAWIRLSKLMYLFWNSEVFLKQTFNIDVFILKLISILPVRLSNLCIYVQTQKYIWSRFPK